MNDKGFSIFFLSSKDLDVIRLLVNEPKTITDISNSLEVEYECARKRLKKMENRGLITCVNDLTSTHSSCKVFFLNPDLSDEILKTLD